MPGRAQGHTDHHLAAPTVQSIEMEMIQHGPNNGCPTGAATWISKALKVEEAQILLSMDVRSTTVPTENQRLALLRRRERLHSQVDGLMQCAMRYLGEDLDDILCHARQGIDIVEDGVEDDDPGMENVEATVLPLPSYLDGEYVDGHGIRAIADMELSASVPHGGPSSGRPHGRWPVVGYERLM